MVEEARTGQSAVLSEEVLYRREHKQWPIGIAQRFPHDGHYVAKPTATVLAERDDWNEILALIARTVVVVLLHHPPDRFDFVITKQPFRSSVEFKRAQVLPAIWCLKLDDQVRKYLQGHRLFSSRIDSNQCSQRRSHGIVASNAKRDAVATVATSHLYAISLCLHATLREDITDCFFVALVSMGDRLKER